MKKLLIKCKVSTFLILVEIEGYFDVNNEYTDKNGNKISRPSIVATSIKKVNFPKEEKIEEPKTEEPIDLSTIPF